MLNWMVRIMVASFIGRGHQSQFYWWRTPEPVLLVEDTRVPVLLVEDTRVPVLLVEDTRASFIGGEHQSTSFIGRGHQSQFYWLRIPEPVLLVEDTRVPRENHWSAANTRQILSHNVVSSIPCQEWDSNSQC